MEKRHPGIVSCNGRYRNYMDEMLCMLDEIDCKKPEPEVCNVSCPPFGCPRGPCPGMCCYEGVCDPCAVSQMPDCPPPPHRPRCKAPPSCFLRAYASYVGWPPESPLSPLSARLTRKLCYETLGQICPAYNCPPPICSTVPFCPSPCCRGPASTPYPSPCC